MVGEGRGGRLAGIQGPSTCALHQVSGFPCPPAGSVSGRPRTAPPRLLHARHLLGTTVLPRVLAAMCMTRKIKCGEFLDCDVGRRPYAGASWTVMQGEGVCWERGGGGGNSRIMILEERPCVGDEG